jgi:hypothetical protein
MSKQNEFAENIPISRNLVNAFLLSSDIDTLMLGVGYGFEIEYCVNALIPNRNIDKSRK